MFYFGYSEKKWELIYHISTIIGFVSVNVIRGVDLW